MSLGTRRGWPLRQDEDGNARVTRLRVRVPTDNAARTVALRRESAFGLVTGMMGHHGQIYQER